MHVFEISTNKIFEAKSEGTKNVKKHYNTRKRLGELARPGSIGVARHVGRVVVECSMPRPNKNLLGVVGASLYQRQYSKC